MHWPSLWQSGLLSSVHLLLQQQRRQDTELARGQQLLAAALQRAEQAEMELSALKLDDSAGYSSTLCLADTPTAAAATEAPGFRALPGNRGGSGNSSPRQLAWQPGSAFAATVAAASDEELRRQLLAAQQELMAARAELRAARYACTGGVPAVGTSILCVWTGRGEGGLWQEVVIVS